MTNVSHPHTRTDDRPLFLVGFMASGKTTVGRLVAARLGWAFHDLDQMIVAAAGRSVAALFADPAEGEEGFRRREAEAVRAAAALRGAVVATGGGAACVEDNLRRMLESGRVVTLSSTGHRIGRIDFDDLNWERKPYRPWRAYGQSKLANLLFTAELQRRLAEAGSPVLATAAHPGYAATNLQFHSGRRLNEVVSRIGNRVLAQDEDGGALPTLYAAVADVPPAAFAGPGGFLEQRGAPRLVGRSGAASDMAVARRLWDVSEQLTGVRFPLAPAPATA